MPGLFEKAKEKVEALSDDDLKKASGGAYTGSLFLYTVQKTDNLSMLAHRYGTTVGTLMELNDIKTAADVHEGVRLLIPLRG